MTTTRSAATPPDAFWEALEAEHARTVQPSRRARQAELLRLRNVIDHYRDRHFPDLPAITIAGESLAARALGNCSPTGSWGQGYAIAVRDSLLVPIKGDGRDSGRSSLIWHQPLRANAAGEQLRQLEVDLVVLHELVRVEHQTRHDRGEDVQFDSEASSYGGHGRWFLARCNEIWGTEAQRLGLPFAPVRHSRIKREQVQQFVREADPALQPLTWLRPTCAHWPLSAIATPWAGQLPAQPTEAEQQAIDLLPALIAAHHQQALAGTNAAEALVELPPVPVVAPQPAPPPRPVVLHLDVEESRETPSLPPMTSQDSPPTVHDLAHHAEDRITAAAEQDPLLGAVIDLLRRRGELATAADWQQIADTHHRAVSTVRGRSTRARKLLIAAGVTLPRKAQLGDHVALASNPTLTATVAGVDGSRAYLQVHNGSTNQWIEAQVADLDVVVRPGPVRSARVERIIARRRAQRAQAAANTTATATKS